VKMGSWKMETIVKMNVPDDSFYGKAVEVTSSFEGEVIEANVLVPEVRQVHVQVQQIVPGIDPAAYPCVVKPFQVFIKKIYILVDLFGRDDKAEILIGGDSLCRFDIAGVVFVKKSLKAGWQVMDGELAYDSSVEFVAYYGNGLVVVHDAGLYRQ